MRNIDRNRMTLHRKAVKCHESTSSEMTRVELAVLWLSRTTSRVLWATKICYSETSFRWLKDKLRILISYLPCVYQNWYDLVFSFISNIQATPLLIMNMNSDQYFQGEDSILSETNFRLFLAQSYHVVSGDLDFSANHMDCFYCAF